jgi:hypothetical protein
MGAASLKRHEVAARAAQRDLFVEDAHHDGRTADAP